MTGCQKLVKFLSFIFLFVLILSLSCSLPGSQIQPTQAAQKPSPETATDLPRTTPAPLAVATSEFCPPMSAPYGPTVTVSTEAELRSQATNAAAGTTILIQPGTYNLTTFIHIIHNGITLRSATGNRADVILDGGGMLTWTLTHVILIEADDVTIADLTIRNGDEHGVSVNGTDGPALYNLHIYDTGYQLVKVNPVGNGSEDGTLACSRLEYTTNAPSDYTNGISAHDAHRWTVRDNQWVRIRTPGNVPAPTILFWSGSSDTVVERNILVDCFQGIAFGNASHGAGDHTGGVVRNNFIYASQPHDSVIEMVHATGWLVANNTALLLNPYGGITWGMEARFADTTGSFVYNLTNLPILTNRDGAAATASGNITNAVNDWFADPAAGNLHLSSDAIPPVDAASALPQVPTDIDGDPRPIGDTPDIGADEYFNTEVYLPLITQIPAASPPGLRLQPADLTYLGAFRLPADVPDEYGWMWSGNALTYFPDGDPSGPTDNFSGSLFGTGHNWNTYVSEISIPVPVKSAAKNLAELNTAATLQAFADIRAGLFDYLEIPRAGLAYLPAMGSQTSGKLYFAWAQHMGQDEYLATHGWSNLDLDDPHSVGTWRVGEYANFVTGDYLFPIPQNWADTYLSGMSLATGRYRDGGQGAQGPSVIAIAPWQSGNPPAAGTTLSATPLLLYQDVTVEGGAMLNNYHHSDEWEGASWLAAGDKTAVVFVGTKGTGSCWYGCADGTVWEEPYPPACSELDGSDRGWWSTGFEAQILFYDPADLAAVVDGTIETWEPQPYAVMNIDPYLYNVTSSQQKTHIGAAAFDAVHSLLYIMEPLVDEDRSIIHVWRVGP